MADMEPIVGADRQGLRFDTTPVKDLVGGILTGDRTPNTYRGFSIDPAVRPTPIRGYGPDMARYPTKHATSAGGLVYDDRADGRWVVVIAHRSATSVLQWTLPKGGLEPREDLQSAAVREVREETGLDAAIERKLGVVDYWFVWRADRVRYHKYVHYYLMVLQGGDFSRRDDEAEDIAWLPIDTALQRLTHPNEARLVRQAVRDGDPE